MLLRSRRFAALPALALAAALVLAPASAALADTADDITVGTFTSPRGLIYSPDGATLYVADEASTGMAVLDLATGTLTEHTTAVGGHTGYLAISSDGRYVYSSGSGVINVFDTVSHTSTTITADSPMGLALSPDDSTLYVASILHNRVDSYDVATGTVLDTYAAGSFPIDVALSADGSRLWIANSRSGYVTTYPTSDPADQTDVPVSTNFERLALSPDGATIWAVSDFSSDLVPIDTASLTVGSPISIAPNHGSDVAVHPDGQRIFVVDRDEDEIVVVDGVSRTVAARVPAGNEPWQLAVAPDGSGVAAAHYFSTFVTVYTRPSASIAGDAAQEDEPGSTLTLTATTSAASTFDSVQWQVDTGSGFTDIPSATTLTLDVTVGVATQYRLVARSIVFGDVPSAAVTVEQEVPAEDEVPVEKELPATGVGGPGGAWALSALLAVGAGLLMIRRRDSETARRTSLSA